MSFWTSTLRTRRKAHRCETCGREVQKGAQSFDEAGMADGDFSSYRQCVPCHDLVARLYAVGVLMHCETWYLGDLPEIARGAGEPWPPCDSGSGSQSEDAPQSAAEAEGPQSGAAKTAHRPNTLSSPSHPESTP